MVDYVLRFRNLNRIITSCEIINNNQLKIFVPEQIDLQQTDYYQLVIYKIDNIPDKTNIFTYKNIEDISYQEDNSIIINNSLNSIIVDSILKNDNKTVLFQNQLFQNNLIKYILPNESQYINLINNIIIYTNKISKSITVTEEETDQVHWTIVENNQSVIITHNLKGDVNIILRNLLDATMFKYSDYIINENQIQIIFPEDANVIKNFNIDLYLIYQPTGELTNAN